MGMTRRRLLTGGGAILGAGLLGGLPARAQPVIRPRSDWGHDLPPTGPLALEAPDDVRFLLLHHTATANDYAPEQVPGLLGGFYRHHTTANGWPDVAYNFFVDRFGGVWEGRTGSLGAPVRGDATGGSQGFALLCAFVGDHRVEEPTPAAVEAMAGLLAGLARRYGIDPAGSASFTSRGSNRWPAGVEVVTPTIAGHRDMSLTECPGDAGYAVVTGVLPGLVRGLVPPTPEPPPDPVTAPEPQPEPDPHPVRTPEAAPAPPPQPPARRVSGWTAAAAASLAAGAGAAVAAGRRGGRHRREP